MACPKVTNCSRQKALDPLLPETAPFGLTSSLLAAINRPPDILPAGEKLRRVHSQTNINQKQGLNYEDLQIVRCIHTHVLRASEGGARSCSGTGRRLSWGEHG